MKTSGARRGIYLLVALVFHVLTREALAASTNNIAVLDFKVENPAANEDERVAGLEDFFEVALQQQGVPVLERRNIRLVLSERALQSSGRLSVETLSEAKLPAVDYFVSGSVAFPIAHEFDLTVSIVRADKATVESAFTKHGNYPDDWLPAIESLAKEVNQRLQLPKRKKPERSEFEAMTWIPEAALPFFKGLDYFGRGDYAASVPWFRKSYGKDRNFEIARRWEARAYQKLNLPQLANALPSGKTNGVAESKSNRPVVAVMTSDKISAAERAAFLQALGRNDGLELFDPGAIGATADELDLQLTGEMASPFGENSVWLVVDDLIYLDATDAKSFSARQQNLLSGQVVRESKITAENLGADNADKLARALLKNKATTGGSNPETNPVPLPEPARNEPGETALPKALRLAQANPDRARLWVGLADFYGDREKSACLDAAIDAVQRQREQPDASFWLASALWRKREASSRIFYEPTAIWHAPNPLTNDLAPLLAWFPKSPEAASLVEATNHGGGSYRYVEPAERRYLSAVFTNIAALPFRTETQSARSHPPMAKDTAPDQIIQLTELVKRGRNAPAWQLANVLRVSADPSIKAQVQPVYQRLLQTLLRERVRYQEFTLAVGTGKQESALELGGELSTCVNRRQRADVIKQSGEIINQREGAVAQLKYLFAQVRQYRDDFVLDPVTGQPNGFDEYQLADGTSNAVTHVIYGRDYFYEPQMGSIAEMAHDLPATDLTREILNYIRNDDALPREKQLTAAFDLAMLELAKGNGYEALAQLKEVLRQTEGSGLPLKRNNNWSQSIESAAFDSLRKVRVYSGMEINVSDCCGRVPSDPPKQPANFDEVNRKLARLWRQQIGELETNLPSIDEQLLADKDNFFPVILYKLRTGQEVSHTLIFCSDLGTNALPALPVIAQIIQRGEPFQDYNNALNALGALGKAAGCAKPLLILARANADNGNFNYAFKRIGPAPRRVMPQLAQLLYHKNPEVCKQAAQAMIETAHLEQMSFKNLSSEQKVEKMRHWWEETGISQSWNE